MLGLTVQVRHREDASQLGELGLIGCCILAELERFDADIRSNAVDDVKPFPVAGVEPEVGLNIIQWPGYDAVRAALIHNACSGNIPDVVAIKYAANAGSAG